jgi:hypothetical protein
MMNSKKQLQEDPFYLEIAKRSAEKKKAKAPKM